MHLPRFILFSFVYIYVNEYVCAHITFTWLYYLDKFFVQIGLEIS